mmetsp:Transcript_33839/g.81400  ORF Transcript_33839/g.81400 Transcript_33839/m.81400 type:complete len:198 (+) Transcript_33839:222-815(+)
MVTMRRKLHDYRVAMQKEQHGHSQQQQQQHAGGAATIVGKLKSGASDCTNDNDCNNKFSSWWCVVLIGLLVLFVVLGGSGSDNGSGSDGHSMLRIFSMSTPPPTPTPTPAPTPAPPSPAPTPKPTENASARKYLVDCGCPTTCTSEALDSSPNRMRFSCRQRIQFLLDTYNTIETDACKIATEQGWCDNKCMPGICQ